MSHPSQLPTASTSSNGCAERHDLDRLIARHLEALAGIDLDAYRATKARVRGTLREEIVTAGQA